MGYTDCPVLTGIRLREWSIRRRLYWAVMAGLLLVVGLGAARVQRATSLTASINEGVSAEIRLDNALELARRVGERFRHVDEHGPFGYAAAWPLRSDADYLLTGGNCGQAAGALGAVFASRGRPFRVIQVNVGPQGAGHIMFETPDDAGQWVLIDPFEGHGFRSPVDGRYLGIDEIRVLPEAERGWLPEEYRTGDSSLFTPYRRTNWARVGPLAGALRRIKGEQWMHDTSLRAMVLKADRIALEAAVVALVMLAIAGLVARRRAAAG
jgi:hypothetical protein